MLGVRVSVERKAVQAGVPWAVAMRDELHTLHHRKDELDRILGVRQPHAHVHVHYTCAWHMYMCMPHVHGTCVSHMSTCHMFMAHVHVHDTSA